MDQYIGKMLDNRYELLELNQSITFGSCIHCGLCAVIR